MIFGAEERGFCCFFVTLALALDLSLRLPCAMEEEGVGCKGIC